MKKSLGKNWKYEYKVNALDIKGSTTTPGGTLTESALNRAFNSLTNQYLNQMQSQMYPPINTGSISAAIKNSMIYGTGYSRIGYEPNYTQIFTDEVILSKPKNKLADWFKYHK